MLRTCKVELATCQVKLGRFQLKLGTFQVKLGTCKVNLGTFKLELALTAWKEFDDCRVAGWVSRMEGQGIWYFEDAEGS